MGKYILTGENNYSCPWYLTARNHFNRDVWKDNTGKVVALNKSQLMVERENGGRHFSSLLFMWESAEQVQTCDLQPCLKRVKSGMTTLHWGKNIYRRVRNKMRIIKVKT